MLQISCVSLESDFQPIQYTIYKSPMLFKAAFICKKYYKNSDIMKGHYK